MHSIYVYTDIYQGLYIYQDRLRKNIYFYRYITEGREGGDRGGGSEGRRMEGREGGRRREGGRGKEGGRRREEGSEVESGVRQDG